MTAKFVIPDEMRALVLDGTGFEHLQVRQVPTPRPGPGQMLARVGGGRNLHLADQAGRAGTGPQPGVWMGPAALAADPGR